MIIASRELTLRNGSNEIKIPIRIFAPECEKCGAWSCRYEIDWPDKKSVMDVWGSDSMQAIILAFQMIGAEIYTSNYHKLSDLLLEAPGRGYGFPVTAGLRGLLEGDDAKFF